MFTVAIQSAILVVKCVCAGFNLIRHSSLHDVMRTDFPKTEVKSDGSKRPKRLQCELNETKLRVRLEETPPLGSNLLVTGLF